MAHALGRLLRPALPAAAAAAAAAAAGAGACLAQANHGGAASEHWALLSALIAGIAIVLGAGARGARRPGRICGAVSATVGGLIVLLIAAQAATAIGRSFFAGPPAGLEGR